MSVQGYLKIKTKIDNRDVDKGISELEDKIKKVQLDNSSLSEEERNLLQEINDYEQLTQKADEYRNKVKELKAERKSLFVNGGLPSSQLGNYQSLTSEIDETIAEQTRLNTEIDKQASKIDKVYSKLDKVKAKQTENNAKITQFKQKIEQIKLNKIQNSLDSVGKSIQGQISKVGKLAFAIFGIRTAWNAVRSAMNIVSQYNPQIAADIEYIRYALASSLVPIIQKLISLTYTLLNYINAILNAWFGINLFSNSSADAFKKMKAGASGTAKAAKEIKKSLQGFDEMNILQDNSDNSSGGAGSAMPSMNLGDMQGKVPEWLQWILDNKDIILSAIAGIVGGIISLKALNLLKDLGLIEGKLVGIKALGIGTIIMGVVYALENLFKYLEDPSWDNFGDIFVGIGIAVIGLGITILGLPGIIAGVVVLIWGTIVKYWDKIKGFLQGGIDWLTGKSDWVHEMFGDTIGAIYDTFVENLQLILDWIDTTMQGIKYNFDQIIQFFKNVFSGNWEAAWENIKNIFKNIWENGIVNTVKTVWQFICNIFGQAGTFFKGVFTNAYNSIKNVFSSIGSFFSGIWDRIKGIFSGIGQKIGDAVGGAFRGAVNAVLRTIENVLNTPIRAVNRLIGVINAVPGVNLGYLSTFSLPRLAKGGIIAQPTTAIIGEAGTEAVMPLENNTEWIDMLADKLASKIGSGGAYIIQMDGRTVQRGIARRQQELAFATNGR